MKLGIAGHYEQFSVFASLKEFYFSLGYVIFFDVELCCYVAYPPLPCPIPAT